MVTDEAGPLLAHLKREVGPKHLFFDHLKRLIEGGSVSSAVAAVALERVAKAALAAGVLLTQPLGVRDFRYRFEVLDASRRELVMQPESHIPNAYLRCRLQFVFAADGYLSAVPGMRLEYVNLEEQRKHT